MTEILPQCDTQCSVLETCLLLVVQRTNSYQHFTKLVKPLKRYVTPRQTPLYPQEHNVFVNALLVVYGLKHYIINFISGGKPAIVLMATVVQSSVPLTPWASPICTLPKSPLPMLSRSRSESLGNSRENIDINRYGGISYTLSCETYIKFISF